jgi:hypothetical protein
MPTATEPAKKAVKVILDSNALFVPLQFRIDIFEELPKLLNTNSEPVLLSPIKDELERLSKEGTAKAQKDANFALKLAEKCRLVEIGKTLGSPDDIIVRVASEWRCPVFTNDAGLKKRLRDINVPVIYVRQKSRLEIEGRL